MGPVGAVVAEGKEVRAAADMAEAAAEQRHTVADPDRDPVAGRPRAVRAVGPGLRPVPALATGRHLEAHHHRAAVPGRREGVDHLGCQRRLDGVPCPPARRRGGQKGDLQKEPPGGIETEPDDHGLGCSRGGLTTKVHLAVEQGQKSMSIVITAGQCGDSPPFEPVLERIRVPRQGLGRPRKRPDKVRADKAYGSRKNRAYLRRRGIRCTIPEKKDPIRNRKKLGSRGGRPPKSTRPTTASAMRSSAASIASNATVLWPPDMTNSRSATKRPCWSRPSTSGCDQHGCTTAYSVIQ